MTSLVGRGNDNSEKRAPFVQAFVQRAAESKAGQGFSVQDQRNLVSWKKPMDPN